MEPSPPPLLSVCMIVKNEEANLGRALASLEGLGADVVVVDTGSTDRTREIALEHGARVVSFVWIDDFSAARNFAFDNARGAWMFVLDADEELSPELRAGLGAALEGCTAGGVQIPVLNVDADGKLQQRMTSTRIVRNGRGYGYEGSVHEDIEQPILRAGGALAAIDLALVHHGYTAHESRRKGRHERNLRLVMASHERAPDEPRYWHYLGLELAIGGDVVRASSWFERVLSEHPEHPLAGWSASQLATIRESERAFGAAWDAAEAGTRARLGRVMSLLRLGELAVREGDAPTALACADALEKIPLGAEGDVERRRERTVVLRARGLCLRGAGKEAFALLVRATRTFDGDAGVADALVRVAEQLHPPARAATLAVQQTCGAPAVLAASLGSFVRQRRFADAAELGDKHGLRNEHYAYALLRTGRAREALEVLSSFGEAGAVHVVLHGLELGDRATVEAGLAVAPPSWSSAALDVLAQKSVKPAYDALVTDWIALALSFRGDALASALASCLPLPKEERDARSAILLYESGEPMSALQQALRHPDQTDAQQVIGLVALERGDITAAAQMLLMCGRSGDVPVDVVLKGCKALVAQGRPSEARELLAIGRASRPHSRAIAALRV